MKKFLSFILCASLLLVSVIMSACNDDKTYWETSYKNISQTLAEEKYTFVFDQSKMQRKDNIKTACETNENFKMLVEVYDFCFYQSIGFVKTYYQGLQIKPILMTKTQRTSKENLKILIINLKVSKNHAMLFWMPMQLSTTHLTNQANNLVMDSLYKNLKNLKENTAILSIKHLHFVTVLKVFTKFAIWI